MTQSAALSPSGELQALVDILDDALLLLAGHDTVRESPTSAETIPPALFEQCIDLCRHVERREAEPIRTIHHLSCSGGTLLVKCLAAMPNVMVLNEVDPLSTMLFDPEKPHFSPTDFLALVRQGDNKASDSLLIDLFVQNLETLRLALASRGKRLLLRDHSHSHFLMDIDIAGRPSVLNVIADHFSTRSILTVRNPLDSFLSLETLGWKNFSPFTFDEYCIRYAYFLDAHQGLPIYRYEDFVSDPQTVMQQMCEALHLPYSPVFSETFDVFRFSGDSGRSGKTISHRARRSCNDGFLEDAKASLPYRSLLDRLGYEPFP